MMGWLKSGTSIDLHSIFNWNLLSMPLHHSLPVQKANFRSKQADSTPYSELTGSLNRLELAARYISCRFQAFWIQSSSDNCASQCCTTNSQICDIHQKFFIKYGWNGQTNPWVSLHWKARSWPIKVLLEDPDKLYERVPWPHLWHSNLCIIVRV